MKLVSHQKQWEFLKKSAELGKLPHALLFYGQEHLGKKKLAIDFVKSLIGSCPEKGTNPDFILVETENKEIQISQIRNLIEKLSFKPYLSNFKFAVIDNAHLMTREAQNCFLKFLEEPKEKTFIILITAHPALLLPTVLSRVQKIRFFPTKGFEIKDKEEFNSDLIKISQSDFSIRFQYAKEISQENLDEVLDAWLRYFRKIFISRLFFISHNSGGQDPFHRYSLLRLSGIIKQIQSTKFLICSTNVNLRLAIEILLMKL